MALVLERGLATREAVESVRSEWTHRSSRGERLPSLAQLLCERNVLDRAVAARLLQEVRGRRAQRIGRYELGAELGRGGMGMVCRARAPDGAEVAVKIMSLAADPEVLVGFDRERRLLSSLGERDGFVPVLDSGVDGARAFLVMPLLAGGTLRERMNGRALPVKEAVELVLGLARAMGKAHARGIIHRDLKPANILFPGKGQPLIADLGLGKHFRRDLDGGGGSVSYSVTGAIAGTTGYMSPEQLEDSKRAGPACDVFALGVILYECVAGVRPFLGPGMMAYSEALRAPPTPLRRAARSVPAWLDAVVTKALARDPAARFKDGAAFAEALEEGLSRRPGWRYPLGAGALTLAVMILAFALSRETPRLAPPAPPARPPLGPVAPPAGLTDAPASSDVSAASELVKRAIEEVKRNDAAGAFADFTRALELDPANAETWCWRAQLRGTTRDPEGALADYGEAIARDPKMVLAWRLRGGTRGLLGDAAGAESDFTRAIELDGRVVTDYENRGVARMGRGDKAGALADANQAIELDPTSAKAWCIRGIARDGLGDREGARDDFTRCIELDARDEEAYFHRAIVLADLGDMEHAASDIEAASRLDPSDPRLAKLRVAIEELKKQR